MINEEFIQQLNEARAKKKTIGLVQGSWDLFHLGHLRYILKARELCDFLIIAMDSDEKIRKRKGESRPVIPEDERREFIELLDIADRVIVKEVNEAKWNLIRTIKPDVLIAIKDNYSDEEIIKLEEYCGRVAILPRQSESSTSDKIRKIIISSRTEEAKKLQKVKDKVEKVVEEIKKRNHISTEMKEPLPMLLEQLKESTDWICPVAAGCYWNGKWYFGTNQSNFNIPKYDIENRTELYYATTEHAEINLLKKLGNVEVLNVPIWTTLFPCDKCLKVLIDKGVKEIFYLEDHPTRNWSKRSHALAEKHGIKTTRIIEPKQEEDIKTSYDYNKFSYIYPPNARHQKQLDIMMNLEQNGIDPLDPNIINQEILFTTDYWYISQNRFPYEEVEYQFLIVSRYPIYETKDMPKEMWIDLQNIWLRLTKEYNIPGGALCFRNGDPSFSGASLKRLHAHLIMPKENQKTKFTIGGNKTLKKGLYLRKKDNEH